MYYGTPSYSWLFLDSSVGDRPLNRISKSVPNSGPCCVTYPAIDFVHVRIDRICRTDTVCRAFEFLGLMEHVQSLKEYNSGDKWHI